MKDVDAAVAALMAQRPEWAKRIVLAGVRGSDAHGTKLPDGHPMHTDDTDTFGVSVHDRDWYLGLDGYAGSKHKLSWDTAGDHYDHLIHDIRKFFSLLLKGNPNVHCWLWSSPGDVRMFGIAGSMIVENRETFLSRNCFNALAGYARAQMSKMEKKRFQGYQGKKRRELVEQIGYDVKHAAHCIRLLTMGIELATTGAMSTRRPSAESTMLMAIKAGEWSFAKTEARATELWCAFQDAEKASDVREKPDYGAANSLMLNVMQAAWDEQP